MKKALLKADAKGVYSMLEFLQVVKIFSHMSNLQDFVGIWTMWKIQLIEVAVATSHHPFLRNCNEEDLKGTG